MPVKVLLLFFAFVCLFVVVLGVLVLFFVGFFFFFFFWSLKPQQSAPLDLVKVTRKISVSHARRTPTPEWLHILTGVKQGNERPLRQIDPYMRVKRKNLPAVDLGPVKTVHLLPWNVRGLTFSQHHTNGLVLCFPSVANAVLAS